MRNMFGQKLLIFLKIWDKIWHNILESSTKNTPMILNLSGSFSLSRTSSADNFVTSLHGISVFMSTAANRLKTMLEVN